MRTTSLRRQHDSALQLAGEITAKARQLGQAPARTQALEVTLLLAKLTGLLRIHFAQEDRSLYPTLMASSRGGVAEMARRFFEEMGQIGPAYAAFSAKWSSVDTLVAAPAAFEAECAAIFGALAARIERENNELYPAVDAEHDQAAQRAA